MRVKRWLVTTSAVLGLVAAAGCGSSKTALQDDVSSTAASPPSASSPAGQVDVVNIRAAYNNYLQQSCEALSGIFADVHTGVPVTIEDAATGEEVGRGRLGKSDVPVPDGLCGWAAVISAPLDPAKMYDANVADRWTSSQFDVTALQSDKPVVITIK